jgi:hypothetical protein
MKWGITFANISDMKKAPELLSYPQQLGERAHASLSPACAGLQQRSSLAKASARSIALRAPNASAPVGGGADHHP